MTKRMIQLLFNVCHGGQGNRIFKNLEVFIEENKTSQALCQQKQRIISSVESSRPMPTGGVP